MTTTPPEPTYPYCVTVIKPGYDSVHLGFPYHHQAEMAATSLRTQLQFTTHPAGTTLLYGPTPADTEPEPPTPTEPHQLAALIDEMPSGDPTGSTFPDLYSRLCAQEGDEARVAWKRALNVIEELGVTAGYNLEQNTWHVEVHRHEQPVEIIPIVAPQIPDQETARILAEQIADNLDYRHMPVNRGLTTPADLIEQVRAATWMTGEDDPSLLEEIGRLRRFEQAAEQLGWTRVTDEPKVITHYPDGVMYAAAGLTVVAAPGVVGANTTSPLTGDPAAARALGVALILAAKQAEDMQRALDLEAEAAAASSVDSVKGHRA